MDIEIKDRNPIKDFFHKLHSRFEDMMFSVIQKTPEKFIPQWLMNWLDRYLNKRINELRQQNIKQTWRKMYLEKAADEISNRQQDTQKAPSDD